MGTNRHRPTRAAGLDGCPTTRLLCLCPPPAPGLSHLALSDRHAPSPGPPGRGGLNLRGWGLAPGDPAPTSAQGHVLRRPCSMHGLEVGSSPARPLPFKVVTRNKPQSLRCKGHLCHPALTGQSKCSAKGRASSPTRTPATRGLEASGRDGRVSGLPGGCPSLNEAIGVTD